MQLAPIRNKRPIDSPWEGNCLKKPWEYAVSISIPVLDTVEPLKLSLELWQLQTIKPYIIIIDTGSLTESYLEIEKLRCENVEVHSLRLNGVEHPSDFVAMACDLAAAVCRTPYMIWTHADCFIKKQSIVGELLELCNKSNPVVGYRLSPRAHEGWEEMFGHTLLITNMEVYLKERIMWNLKQFCYYYELESHKPTPAMPNYPDTEVMANLLYQDCGIKPLLIGDEKNFARNQNEHFDHCRTYTSGLLYSPEYFKICDKWMQEAMKDAENRIAEWKSVVKPT